MQATVCAKFGLPCIIYMGSKDMERQALNVFRMRLLGAEVRRPSFSVLESPCCLMIALHMAPAEVLWGTFRSH